MPDAALISECVKLLGGGGILFVIWLLSFRSESKKWEGIIQMENGKWTDKFKQDKEERDRQYDIFVKMMENVTATTGLLAILDTKINNVPVSIKEIHDRMDNMERTLREGLREIHGRIDRALDKECP